MLTQNCASRYRSSRGVNKRRIAEEAYQKARDDLRNEIHLTGRAALWAESHTTVEDVLAAVQEIKKNYEDTSEQHTGVRTFVEKLSRSVMYYGKVFDCLAQHHPEYVALVWGTMKFVLMGIIERATLIEQLAIAITAIGDALPLAGLSAELYQTDDMKDAVSKLYICVIRFLHLCVRWYSRSSVGRFFSGLKNPFKLDYQDLLEQVKVCSIGISNLANAGLRVEVRDISTIQSLRHTEHMNFNDKLFKQYKGMDDTLKQILQLTVSSDALTKGVSLDVRELRKSTGRVEYNLLVEYLAPAVSPEDVLLRAQAFVRRSPTMSLASPAIVNTKRTLKDWALSDRSSLLVIRMGLRAQKQARELTAEVIQGLATSTQSVFWNLSLPCSSGKGQTTADVLKSLLYQALRSSTDLFAQFPEQLSLTKIRGSHSDAEWTDLLCLVFAKVPNAFIVIETEDLYKIHGDDPEWSARMVDLLQKIVDQTTAACNRLKVLLVVYGNASKIPTTSASKVGDPLVLSVPPPAAIPPRLRHMARRTGLDTRSWRLQKPKI